MARTTEIEWTEHTWNPFVGCSRVSEGCFNCYAVGLAVQCEGYGTPHYRGISHRGPAGRMDWTGKIAQAPQSIMRKPEGIKAPSLIFVNSMSDFWHESATDEMRLNALEIMRRTPRHAYQVLTKRPENILPMLNRMKAELPSNFWAGTTVENQKAKARIDLLRKIPAKVRFLSVEPLLEELGELDLTDISWVIVGGESGLSARPMKADWVRSVRNQCELANVPFFFKQWGHARNNPLFNGNKDDLSKIDPVGKGGSKLDGRNYKSMPAGWASPPPAEGTLSLPFRARIAK